MNVPRMFLVFLLRVYQRLISPLFTLLLGPFGFGCRFQPTCSQYAIDAIRTHGCFQGIWLTLRRLGRCHPWGPHGHDPVPPPKRQAGQDSKFQPNPSDQHPPTHTRAFAD